MLPFMNAKHDATKSFILQEDSCGPHRARSIATYLYQKAVNRMKRPAQSPEQNTIENIWGIMKSKLRKRNVHPTSTSHLFQILTEMWHSLPDSAFDDLVASMPKRARMVRQVRVRSTKY